MMKVNQKKQHQLKTDLVKHLEKNYKSVGDMMEISQQKERVQLNIFDFDSMDQLKSFIHRRRKTYVFDDKWRTNRS